MLDVRELREASLKQRHGGGRSLVRVGSRGHYRDDQ